MTGIARLTLAALPPAERGPGRFGGPWLILAAALWLVALGIATGGYFLGRTVFDRGAVYGEPARAYPDTSLPKRAINTQLELEPDDASVQRSLRMIRAAGFGMIRQQFAWGAIEAGGKGQFFDTNQNRSNWERYDAIVRLARAEGIEVLARLDLPPEWARPPGSYKTHPPTDVRDYGDFVADFVAHYKGSIHYVQLWNEPNLNEEWGRQPVDPAGYVELLRAGFDGARRADPAVRVVSAALAQTLEPDDPSASGLDDLLYLDRMYVFGAAPYFDVLAANAYGLGAGPEDRRAQPDQANFSRVLLARDVMRRHGDDAKALWVAEFGWNALPAGWTGQPSPWGQVSPARQAQYILESYARARAEWPWSGPMALWLFRKPGADARDPTPYFALVDQDWQPRPAYSALVATAQEQALGVGIHQEDAPEITFGGAWQSTEDANASGGRLFESPNSGATVRFRFRGTAVALLAPRGPARGTAYARVNDAYTLANRLPLNANGQATADFYAPQPGEQQRIVIADGLPDRVHDVELIVSGEHSAASAGAGVGIDAIVVTRAHPTWPLLALGAGWGLSALAVAWGVRQWANRPFGLPAAIFAIPTGAVATTGTARTPGVTGASRVAGAANPLRGVAVPAALRWLVALPWTRWGVLATVALLPFSPLALRTPAGTYSPVELAAVAAVALWMGQAYLGAVQPVWGRFAPAAVALLLAGALSTAQSDYPRLALRELRTLVVEPVLFYFAARSVLRTPRHGLHLAGALVAGATVAACLALAQTATHRGLIAAEGVARAAALYSSPNNLALLLDRALPVALACALYRPGRERLMWGAAAVLGAGAMFFTFSRGGWLASLAAGVVVCWPLLRRQAPRLHPRLAAGALVALTLASGGALVVALRYERFRSLFSAAGTGFLRFHLWASSARMALDHPFFGVGPDQFLYHYPRYMDPDAWREPNLSHPHNLLLDFWLRLGAIGLVALLWTGWRVVRLRHAPLEATRVSRLGESSMLPDMPLSAVLSLAAAGAAVALVVHGLVDNSYFVTDLAYAFWVVLLLRELATATPAPEVTRAAPAAPRMGLRSA